MQRARHQRKGSDPVHVGHCESSDSRRIPQIQFVLSHFWPFLFSFDLILVVKRKDIGLVKHNAVVGSKIAKEIAELKKRRSD